MDYFFTPPFNIKSDQIIIENNEFVHLVHVMRKKVGDVIYVIDGTGIMYEVALKEIDDKKAHGTITSKFFNYHEPAIKITLAVGILKNHSRFDFLVEKVTEIGVKEIIPIRTIRTIPYHAKVDRWRKLALAAAKQCGRGYIPNITSPKELLEFLQETDKYDLKLIACEKFLQQTSLEHVLTPKVETIVILIGSEGGFTDEEILKCKELGFVPISLGERRLRTETAAIVASAIVIGKSK